jgi:UDP-MurNAc hydroxylase
MFRNKHEPDVYDSVRNTFFVANDTDELAFGLKKLTQFRSNDEYITLESFDGLSTVTCKRFCPHQGGDLKYARFDGRFVICPRHQWRFDCENGGKADQSGDTIDAVIEKLAH